jgi:hypothetical protein
MVKGDLRVSARMIPISESNQRLALKKFRTTMACAVNRTDSERFNAGLNASYTVKTDY